MKVIRKSVITEITHWDIARLFSNALEDGLFGCDNDKDFWHSLCEDCRDGIGDPPDRIADTLIHGGTVYVYDYGAKGQVHREGGEILEDDSKGDVLYKMTLKDIVSGLESAADGSFSSDPSEREDARKKFDRFLNESGYNEFDSCDARTLMQIIVFGKIVYI